MYSDANNDFMLAAWLPPRVVGARRWAQELYINYLQNLSVFRCPSLHSEKFLASSDDLATFPDYGMNYHKELDADPVKTVRIKRASQMINLTDARMTSSTGGLNPENCGFWRVYACGSLHTNFGYPDPRHAERVNVLWLDGHVTTEKSSASNPYSGYPFNALKYVHPGSQQ